MREWQNIAVAVGAAAAAIGLLILLVLLRRRRSLSKDTDSGTTGTPPETQQHMQTGISKLTPRSLHNLDLDVRTRSNSYHVLKQPEVSPAPRFNWADHPSLITDAVEHGWSRFAFAPSHTASSPSVRSAKSTLLGACAAGDRRDSNVEIGWEICPGSADFLQKIRLNSGLKKPSWSHSFIRTGLPLPGPRLGNSSFPQEAYFEITVIENDFDYDPFGNRRRSIGKVEGERAKLIQENMNAKLNYSEWLVHVKNSGNGNNNGNRNFEELRGGGKEESSVMLTIGLSTGGSGLLRVPGSYWGSIGFNSDGSVYLDGIKLIFKSEKAEWGKTDKVIGCGYNPKQRKVFFTVDSELVHVINCKSEEFDTPLYPTLASNIDTTVLVNFGQSIFRYAPANSHRTPNPCFVSPLAKSPVLSNEDSKELFSMGRIDYQWQNQAVNRAGNVVANNNNSGSMSRGVDTDAESEGDLFEIVLDSSGRSPNPVLK